MSYKVPLHELEKAKKVERVTENIITYAAKIGIALVVLVILAAVGSVISLVWSHSIGLAIGILVGLISLTTIIGSMVLNDKARSTIRDARDYGTIDE